MFKFKLNGRKILVQLKTNDWRQQIDKEMGLCSMNTGALFNNVSNSLLGEDFTSTGLYDFESDGMISTCSKFLVIFFSM